MNLSSALPTLSRTSIRQTMRSHPLALLLLLRLCSSCDGWLQQQAKRRKPTSFGSPMVDRRGDLGQIITMQTTTNRYARTIRFMNSNSKGEDAASATASEDIADTAPSSVTLDSLVDMDVVIYSLPSDDDDEGNLRLAAMQEDGVLSPLSAWTMEPAFGESIEFLVDEADRFALTTSMEKIRLHRLLSEEELSYGSRQCHRGVGNPHGEESELLYYVEQDVIENFQLHVDVKPDLEILW